MVEVKSVLRMLTSGINNSKRIEYTANNFSQRRSV